MVLADTQTAASSTARAINPEALVDTSPGGKIASFVRSRVPGLLLIAAAGTAIAGKRKAGAYIAGLGLAVLVGEKRGSWY